MNSVSESSNTSELSTPVRTRSSFGFSNRRKQVDPSYKKSTTTAPLVNVHSSTDVFTTSNRIVSSSCYDIDPNLRAFQELLDESKEGSSRQLANASEEEEFSRSTRSISPRMNQVQTTPARRTGVLRVVIQKKHVRCCHTIHVQQ